MFFRIQGGRSSLARSVSQGAALHQGVVVLRPQAEMLPPLPLHLPRPQSASMSLATSLSVCTLCLWPPGEGLDHKPLTPLCLGDMRTQVPPCISTPNPGSPLGNREPPRLSSAWAQSCKASYGWGITDNKVMKPKETSKTISNKKQVPLTHTTGKTELSLSPSAENMKWLRLGGQNIGGKV